jgi:hypothetical protein
VLQEWQEAFTTSPYFDRFFTRLATAFALDTLNHVEGLGEGVAETERRS